MYGDPRLLVEIKRARIAGSGKVQRINGTRVAKNVLQGNQREED